MAFFQLRELIDAWELEIDKMFTDWPMHWKEFGALRFEEPLNPKSAANMNVAQLGLIALLTSRLRDWTAGFGIRAYSTGQPVPEHGKPCWDIVAEFVNDALEPPQELNGEAARRVWQSMSAKHAITTQRWPKPSKWESQFQKT